MRNQDIAGPVFRARSGVRAWSERLFPYCLPQQFQKPHAIFDRSEDAPL